MRNKSVSHDVYNTLKIGEDDHGGYLARMSSKGRSLKRSKSRNIFRQLAKGITTSSGDRKIPVVASKGNGRVDRGGNRLP
jgi:hypothetical protein